MVNVDPRLQSIEPPNARKLAFMVLYCAALLSALFLLPLRVAYSGDAEDLAEMQKKLNAEVMSKSFSVEETAKIDAYIKEGMKNDLKPVTTPPADWRPGYTCANLSIYNQYRDCLYYHRYHGHYWR